jgi:hypothetical protein
MAVASRRRPQQSGHVRHAESFSLRTRATSGAAPISSAPAGTPPPPRPEEPVERRTRGVSVLDSGVPGVWRCIRGYWTAGGAAAAAELRRGAGVETGRGRKRGGLRSKSILYRAVLVVCPYK